MKSVVRKLDLKYIVKVVIIGILINSIGVAIGTVTALATENIILGIIVGAILIFPAGIIFGKKIERKLYDKESR